MREESIFETLNEQQSKIVTEVYQAELGLAISRLDNRKYRGKQFLHLLHGGPGTGKSHCISIIKRMFEEAFHYTQGIDFEITALQAINAAAITGDTLHHAFGLNPFNDQAVETGKDKDVGSKMYTAAQRVKQWKWLILDEISMVSAELIAQIDCLLRNIMSTVGNRKNQQNLDLPFGGLNILFCGDFFQQFLTSSSKLCNRTTYTHS